MNFNVIDPFFLLKVLLWICAPIVILVYVKDTFKTLKNGLDNSKKP